MVHSLQCIATYLNLCYRMQPNLFGGRGQGKKDYLAYIQGIINGFFCFFGYPSEGSNGNSFDITWQEKGTYPTYPGFPRLRGKLNLMYVKSNK